MRVNNLVPNQENTRVVFVLESPYRAEMNSGYPLAGASGIEVGRVLNEIGVPFIPSGIPFGKYLFESKDDRFAIINCSTMPMDIKFYNCSFSDNISAPLDIDSISFLRRNPWVAPQDRRNKLICACQKSLIKQFSSTWRSFNFHIKGVLIIACGRLSKGFLESIGVKEHFYMPHPSRNQWHYRKYKCIIARLKIRISRQLRLNGK